MQPKLIITFETLSEADYFAKAELIDNSLAANASFPAPWPGALAGPSSLASLFNTYQAAFNAALTHDDIKIVARKTARKALSAYLKKLAPYLEVVANGDVSKLLTTGYTLRRAIVPSSGTDPLPAPDDFQVKRGVLSGVLMGHARKLKGAGSYEVQTAVGNPASEESWSHYATVRLCNRFEIGGQTPGQVVSVRLRGIGSKGPGDWTVPISLMVV